MTLPPDAYPPAVERLVAEVEPPELRGILTKCLSGSVSPAVALMQMLIETEDAPAVRKAVDEVTGRAATLSRASDSILRDRVDDLTQLVVENAPGCDRIAEMLRSNMDSPDQAATVEDGIAFCERLFDWSVQQSEEASVALYSLGNPQLLDRATGEIIAQLERWGVISAEHSLLDIGCGIGRLVEELARRAREVSGIDVSTQMINAALRRCAPLANVKLLKGTGRDLREFGDAVFDAAIAVDTFPYIRQSGTALVETYFGEAARVLKPGGHFVILNYSYGGDDEGDANEIARLAREYEFDVAVSAERPFTLWDGLAFHLTRRDASRGPAQHRAEASRPS